jgi:hypothetical protein
LVIEAKLGKDIFYISYQYPATETTDSASLVVSETTLAGFFLGGGFGGFCWGLWGWLWFGFGGWL